MTLTVLYQDTFDESALDAQWMRQGVTSETLASGQMSTTLGPGQGYTRMLADCNLGMLTDYTVEVALASNANLATMTGPTVLDDTGLGINLSWFNNPNGLLYLSVSNWVYPGGFATAFSAVATFPDRIRLRKSGTNWYASHSTDGGTTWTAEANPWNHSFTPTRLGLVNVNSGNSGAVVVDAITVYADLSTPAQPVIQSAVGFDSGINVAWAADSNVQSYQYRLNGGSWQTVADISVTVSGLTNGTAYTFELQAVNQVGTSPSATTTVTPQAATLFDTYNRPNSTTSLGSPEEGGPYTAVAGTWGINGDALYCASNTSEAMVTFPGVQDFDATINLKTPGPNNGFLFRYVDSSNTWLVQLNTSNMNLYRRRAGTWNQYGSNAAAAAGDVVRVVGLGPRIWIIRNGILLAEVEDEFYGQAVAATLGFRHSADTTARIDQIVVHPATTPPVADYAGSDLVDFSGYGSTPDLNQGFVYKGRDTQAADEGAVS